MANANLMLCFLALGLCCASYALASSGGYIVPDLEAGTGGAAPVGYKVNTDEGQDEDDGKGMDDEPSDNIDDTKDMVNTDTDDESSGSGDEKVDSKEETEGSAEEDNNDNENMMGKIKYAEGDDLMKKSDEEESSSSSSSEEDSKEECEVTKSLQAMVKLLAVMSEEMIALRKQVSSSCSGGSGSNETDVDEGTDDDMGKLTVAPGEVATLVCSLEDDNDDEETKTPSWLWKHDGTEVITLTNGSKILIEDSRYTVTINKENNNTYELAIADVAVEDGGEYICAYETGNQTIKTIVLNVEEESGMEETTVAAAETTTMMPTTTLPPEPTPPPPPSSCPAPFQLLAGGCFYIQSDSREWRSWGEAHAFCQQQGGSLAAPYRAQDLRDYLKQSYSSVFWVGARKSPEGGWQWLTGRPMEVDDWKKGKPSTSSARRCAYLDYWNGYKAVNHFCGEKFSFICEHAGN